MLSLIHIYSLLTVQAAFMDDTPRLTGAINAMAAECEQRVEAGERCV